MSAFRAAVTGIGLLMAVTVVPLAAARAAGCVQTVDLRELMTVANFDQTGLNQLEGAQLAALNGWLSRNGDRLCPVPASPAQSGTTSAACPQPVDLRDFMTVSAFDQAGLNELNPGQIAALNDWMRRNVRGLCGASAPGSGSAGAPPSAGNQNAGEAAFGAPPPRVKTPSRIESRIVGDFQGWTGNTVFTLENGQVWKQAGPGYFQVDLQNPKVVIKKLLIGYVLLVDGYGKEVFVRRVR